MLQKYKSFMSKTFFLQRGEIPGYRHTQVAEIHLSTLLVEEETQQYINTTLMAKEKRVPAYLTRPLGTQGPDISIHQHIDTTLMKKREKGTGIPHKTNQHTRPRHLNTSAHQYNPHGKKEKGTGIPHMTGGHARPKQTAGRDSQPANTSK